jgi:ABC-type microcin C transport system permease subunit YejB
MGLIEIVRSITLFYQNNPLAAIVISIVAIICMFRFPKFFLNLVLLVMILATVYYLISNLSSSVVSQKEQLLRQERVTDLAK